MRGSAPGPGPSPAGCCGPRPPALASRTCSSGDRVALRKYCALSSRDPRTRTLAPLAGSGAAAPGCGSLGLDLALRADVKPQGSLAARSSSLMTREVPGEKNGTVLL